MFVPSPNKQHSLNVNDIEGATSGSRARLKRNELKGQIVDNYERMVDKNNFWGVKTPSYNGTNLKFAKDYKNFYDKKFNQDEWKVLSKNNGDKTETVNRDRNSNSDTRIKNSTNNF